MSGPRDADRGEARRGFLAKRKSGKGGWPSLDMSFLSLCRGSFSNRTMVAATVQPLRTKNASDEAFRLPLLVSFWFMYHCASVCVKVSNTQRIVRNINLDG
ncbi:hypothetical protein J3459_009944 [Metarhizium acridum]|nr:hypothetical protein J3459_009944 [Metarhizium acridum]